MIIGYIRVSKQDESQCHNLKSGAIIKAGVAPERIYEDLCSGRKGGRLHKMTRTALQMAMTDPKSVATDVAKRLGIQPQHFILM